jgi:hypothetical protein
MRLETEALQLAAKRARLFDHMGNRGSEAEQSIVRWLRARFEPEYTASSGEVIDSFGTVETPSRQQDCVIHCNDQGANRFLLPSGLRMVPVETIASVVEIKLTLSRGEFETADRAAAETSRLRLRVTDGCYVPTSRVARPPPDNLSFVALFVKNLRPKYERHSLHHCYRMKV